MTHSFSQKAGLLSHHTIKKSVVVVLIACILYPFSSLKAQNQDSLMLRKLYDYYLTKSKCYSNLDYLATKIGGRISGSTQAEQAVQWAKRAMYAAGADTVYLQPCMVPHWVRGQKEKCSISSTKLKTTTGLNCVAMGSSVGTGAKGIKARVIEVSSFEELEKLGENKIKGNIVFYNVSFDQTKIKTGSAYGEAVKYRSRGASHAAKYGAIGSVVRSMTSVADNEAHTGNMTYDTSISKIKITTIAISYKAADLLHQTLLKDKDALLYIETHCQTLPDAPSFNVVGQITGTEKPNEFIITGGHLDSWDNGQGAHDDGSGVVQSIEILNAFKALGIKPKHSIRAVAFMNEENGLAGGEAYARYAQINNEKHLAALETDAGGFTPRAFGIDTLNGLYNKAVKWKNLFAPYLIERIDVGGGGADIGPLEKLGVPGMAYEPDVQRYFDIHHTAADTFDKINKRELELGAAAIGALLYLIDLHY
ncbi:MAG: M20/M25/M40 family metallo-hydrolase [Bacteroidia bacterium]|nr:M20/M25/M40 family metallo-hydrolase [Bacteroidia bacterium]